jgi:hypothetical protein
MLGSVVRLGLPPPSRPDLCTNQIGAIRGAGPFSQTLGSRFASPVARRLIQRHAVQHHGVQYLHSLRSWLDFAAKPLQHINTLQHKNPDDMTILHLEQLALSEWG